MTMKGKILVMGALGQIGSELTAYLRQVYGREKVIASDLRVPPKNNDAPDLFVPHDCTNADETEKIIKEHHIKTIYNLPAILSARAEESHKKAFEVNLVGLFQTLEIARKYNFQIFTPSSIGVFGWNSPKNKTPQDCIMRPTTIYGVTKLAGELLGDYYSAAFKVDSRGIRYPGIVSHKTLPGGGTTDFAVDIFHQAIKKGRYTSYLHPNTTLDLMYMPDALRATHELMQADKKNLTAPNAYNVAGISTDIVRLGAAIKNHIPHFKIDYQIDPKRQAIADSWPNSIADKAAQKDWGWKAKFSLEEMVSDMLYHLKIKS